MIAKEQDVLAVKIRMFCDRFSKSIVISLQMGYTDREFGARRANRWAFGHRVWFV